MTLTEPFRKISDAEANRTSERTEQFLLFLNHLFEDERMDGLVPNGSVLWFRAITVQGKPFQITAFTPESDPAAGWQARITIGDIDWDRARGLDTARGAFATPDEAIDDLETRLRRSLAPVRAWKTE